MSISICIVTEAMEAYQLFCSTVPRHMTGPLGTEVDTGTAIEDGRSFASWIETYKQERPDQCWELKPVEEILSMLSVLPLNAESYEEVSELVQCLHM